MRKIYTELFGENFRYATLLKILGFEYIIAFSGKEFPEAKSNPESVCITLTKNNWHSSHTWSFAMMEYMDDDTIRAMVDLQIMDLITKICERILNETKF